MSDRRSFRADDELWEAAQQARAWRRDPSLSHLIRRWLMAYVKDTDERRRREQQNQ